ncbi:MAG TPA: ubiquinol-cytochrome c reductase iron-sulfur subunit, partial [Aquabacterium sp.]|nr:ubiquinol-cytochrome c reductase iron-sulfur subunit [Aquabacterium sp.]
MSNQPVDQSRRTWVTMACAAGGAGGVATIVPFVSTFQPSERARAAGAAVEADISTLKPGEMMTVEWRGKPVWILRRSEEQLKALGSLDADLADPKSERKPDELTPEY